MDTGKQQAGKQMEGMPVAEEHLGFLLAFTATTLSKRRNSNSNVVIIVMCLCRETDEDTVFNSKRPIN